MIKVKVFCIAGRSLALLKVAGVMGGFVGNGRNVYEAITIAFNNYQNYLILK